MEYLKFFDLEAEPFQNDLDGRFYYESEPQRQARLRVLRGIHQRKALTVVYGGPGRGKTTLAHYLLRDLADSDVAVRFLSIPHEGCSSGWFLPNVARQYGIVQLAPTIPEQVDQVHARLVEVNTAGKYPVIFVDEAQLFRNRNAMEEFRGLLNLLHEGKKLVSLVLFGLDELREILRLDPPLAQRVDIRIELKAMDREESARYLEHRLKNVGGSLEIFTPDAIDAIYAYSEGVPRVMNSLADNTLFDASLEGANPADASLVAAAADALGLSPADASEQPSGLELDLAIGEVAEAPGIQSIGESESGAAPWVEPAAPSPSSFPASPAAPPEVASAPVPPLPVPALEVADELIPVLPAMTPEVPPEPVPAPPEPVLSSEPVRPPVDPAVLDEAAAALEVIADPNPSPAPQVATQLVADDFPPLNREFVPPAMPAASDSSTGALELESVVESRLEPKSEPELVLSPPDPPTEEELAPPVASAFDPVSPVMGSGEADPLSQDSDDETAPSFGVEIELNMPVEDVQPLTSESGTALELSLPDDEDDKTPLSLAGVITPEQQAELRKQADAADTRITAPTPIPDMAPVAAPVPAPTAAPVQPQAVAAPVVAPAPPEVTTSNEGFHLGSILDSTGTQTQIPAPTAAAPEPVAPRQAPVAAAASPRKVSDDAGPGSLFDLGELLSDVDEDWKTDPAQSAAPTAAPIPAAPAPAPVAPAAPASAPPVQAAPAAGPKIEIPDGEEDLDALFDSIQLGD